MMLTKEQLDKLRGVLSNTPEKVINKPLQSEVTNEEITNASSGILNNLNPKWKNLVERYESSANMQYENEALQYDEFGVVIPNGISAETSKLPKISEFGIPE